MFVCYASSIEDQFEFLTRRWSNTPIQPDFGGHDPAGFPMAFDYEGVAKRRVTLLDQGVCREVVHDTQTAARDGVSSTGHGLPAPNPWGPFPINLLMKPGDATREDLIGGLDRGLLVTRFHYTNPVHPKLAIITGMTRDGTFLALVDPVSGRTAQIGRPNVGLGFGLAFDTANRLYLSLGRRLAVLNFSNGTTKDVADFTLDDSPIEVGAMAFDPLGSRLLGLLIDRGTGVPLTRQVVAINPVSGKATRFGPPSDRSFLALAASSGGVIVADVSTDTTPDLVRLNRGTGAPTRIGSPGVPGIEGLAFDKSGVLHANAIDGRQLTIDTVTAAATVVGHAGQFVRGLTVAAKPLFAGRMVPVTLRWKILGSDLATTTCDAVGADTVKVFGGSTPAYKSESADLPFLGTFPCHDAGGLQQAALSMPEGDTRFRVSLEGGGLRLAGSVQVAAIITKDMVLDIQFSRVGPPSGTGGADLSWTVDEQPAATACAPGNNVFIFGVSGNFGYEFGRFSCGDGVAHLGHMAPGDYALTAALLDPAAGGFVVGLWKTNVTIADGVVAAPPTLRFITDFSLAGTLNITWTINGQEITPALLASFGLQSSKVHVTFDTAFDLGTYPTSLGAATPAFLPPGTRTVLGELTGTGAPSPPHTASVAATVISGKTTTVTIDFQMP